MDSHVYVSSYLFINNLHGVSEKNGTTTGTRVNLSIGTIVDDISLFTIQIVS